MKKQIILVSSAILALGSVSIAQVTLEEQFAPTSPQIPFDIGGSEKGEFAFGDIDGDGDIDIFKTGSGPVNNYYSYSSQIYLNDGAGGYKLRDLYLSKAYRYSSCDMFDADGDNDLDILVAGAYSYGSNVSTDLYLNDGNGNFTISTQTFSGIQNGDLQPIDIENDGDIDFLVSGKDVNNSQITELYENNGSGVFTLNTSSTFSTITNVTIEAGDLNNDGMIDLIFSGNQTSEVYQNTNGVFTLLASNPITAVTGAHPSIQIADVDNDNDNDVLILGSYWSSGTPYMYINNGSFSFTEHTPGPFPNSSISTSSMDVADINGDGNIDIIYTGIKSSGTVTHYTDLLLGDGTGSFTSSTSFDNSTKISGDRNTSDFVDVDGDNDLDILVTGGSSIYNSNSKSTFIHINDGNGVFTKVEKAIDNGFYTADSKIFDIDNDGDNDLLVSGRMNGNQLYNTNVQLYENDGSGALTETSHSFRKIGGAVLLTGDVDGDNDLDVLFSGWDSVPPNNMTTVLYINNNGTYTELTSQGFDNDNIQKGDFVDYDNDGDLDLIGVFTYTSNDLIFYNNNGSGVFTVDNTNTIPGGGDMAHGDYDNDGDIDLFISSETGSGLYLNNSSGVFSLSSGTYTDLNEGQCVKNIDFDNDGDLDIINVGEYSDFMGDTKYSIIYENDGTGSFTSISNSIYGFFAGDISVIDLNDDNFMDLVFLGTYSDGVSDYEIGTVAYINSGTGTFAMSNNNPFIEMIEKSHFTEGDLNGDNKDDLFISGQSNTGALISGLYYSDACNVDLTLTLNGVTISVPSGQGTYQWVDCNNGNSPLSGETSSTFTATTNGDYACIVDNGTCFATTTCQSINNVGLDEETLNSFKLYPNPAEDNFTIEVDNEILKVELYDLSGKLVLSELSKQIKVSNIPKGIYTVVITTNNKVFRQKLVKK